MPTTSAYAETAGPEASVAFVVHAPEFRRVLGDTPRLVKVADADAHEGPVYVECEDALYFTSVPQESGVPAPGFPTVAIRRLQLDGERFPLAASAIGTIRPDAN